MSVRQPVLRIPELGPSLGKLVTGTGRGTVGEGISLDANRCQLATKVMEVDGEAFVSNAIIDGCYVLRACIVNFRTDREDVEALIPIIIRLGEAADGELRPAQLAIP
ncbi:MAG: hypothetical protein IIB90_15220 [Gemmatimonadetes bacterium]|nr:hypothetical protein [Gemmatimonadota bacterium]